MIRCFVAATLPGEAKRWLAGARQELARFCEDVKWVEAENYHLTLKFLGEIEERQLSGIRRALSECGRAAPLRLGFQGVGVFPGLRRARVVWAGVTGEVAGLREIAACLDRALGKLGFPPEDREFRPHLTLGRFRNPADLTPCQEQLQSIGSVPCGPFAIPALHLMQSTLTRRGPVYTPIGDLNLTGAVDIHLENKV
jgi:2'-5' RNA ligase